MLADGRPSCEDSWPSYGGKEYLTEHAFEITSEHEIDVDDTFTGDDKVEIFRELIALDTVVYCDYDDGRLDYISVIYLDTENCDY